MSSTLRVATARSRASDQLRPQSASSEAFDGVRELELIAAGSRSRASLIESSARLRPALQRSNADAIVRGARSGAFEMS